jgi:transcriptional regulator with XRE-family HTH domain
MARHMADLSQQQVAEQVGVSRMAISKYENNQMVPSSDVLIALAKALRQPIEFYLRGVPAPRIRPLSRDRHHLPGKQEEVLVAQLQEWVERYLAAESLFPPAEISQFAYPPGFPWPIAEPDDVEMAAEALRQAWNLGDDPIVNLTELLEERGIKVGLVDGDHEFDADLFELGDGAPLMAVRRDLPGDRQRFSLARELGHLMLDSSNPLDDEEVASHFARAFLVSRNSATYELGRRRHHLSIHELHLLKHRYGVSLQVWIERAKDLDILDEDAAREQLRQFRRHGWHIHEPGDAPAPEQPQRLTRLVLRALAEDVISRSRAEELLGLSWSEFVGRQRQEHGAVPIAVRA